MDLLSLVVQLLVTVVSNWPLLNAIEVTPGQARPDVGSPPKAPEVARFLDGLSARGNEDAVGVASAPETDLVRRLGLALHEDRDPLWDRELDGRGETRGPVS